MRVYCKEAVKFGDEPLSPTRKPRHITVILNPVAKKRYMNNIFIFNHYLYSSIE